MAEVRENRVIDYRMTITTLDDPAYVSLKRSVDEYNASQIEWNRGKPTFLRVKTYGRVGKNNPHGTSRQLAWGGNCKWSVAQRFDVYVTPDDYFKGSKSQERAVKIVADRKYARELASEKWSARNAVAAAERALAEAKAKLESFQ